MVDTAPTPAKRSVNLGWNKPWLRALVEGDCRGLVLPHAGYSTLSLIRMDFREADLREADFRQSWIRDCDFRGANMEHADLTDATFDEDTIWPEGFDPEEHGARAEAP